MEKVLVTTDFSENSKAGLRFAIQLSMQRPVTLIFFHANKLWEEPVFPDPQSETASLNSDRAKLQRELEHFINDVYASMSIKPPAYTAIIHYHFGVVNSMIDYAVNNNCEYICISTHGEGNIRKYIGTNAGELIKDSEVPVFCIPKDYQATPVTRLLYASDLTNYEDELKRVIAFAGSLDAKVDVVHFSDKAVPLTEEEHAIETRLEEELKAEATFYQKERDTKNTLIEDIDQAVLELSPSLLIMFTNQDRSFFELLFRSSKTEQYSFQTRVPMLVFNKRSGDGSW